MPEILSEDKKNIKGTAAQQKLIEVGLISKFMLRVFLS